MVVETEGRNFKVIFLIKYLAFFKKKYIYKEHK